MNTKLLNQIVSAMFFTPRATEEGTVAGGDVLNEEVIETTDAEPIEGGMMGTEPTELDSYIGSKDVNPDQRPLRPFDRDGLTQDEIDGFIAEQGDAIFLTEEEIAELSKDDKKTDDDKTDDSGDDNKPKETDTTDKDKSEEGEFNEDEFYDKTGLSKDEFIGMSEKAQEKLVELYQSKALTDPKQSDEYVELSTHLEKVNKDVADLLKDSVVSARLEELKTGQAYVAGELPPVTKNELEVLKTAATVEVFETELNKIVQARAKEAIRIERTVTERAAQNNKLHREASKIMSSVAKMDPRLGGNVDVDNWADINPNHPAYNDFLKGEKKIVDYCIKRGLKNVHIAKMDPKELYAAISASEGWSKQKEKKIAETSVNKFIKSIRDSRNKAKSVSQGRLSGSSRSKTSLSTDESYDNMVEKLASGDKKFRATFRNMLAAADGDPERLDFLEAVQNGAERLYLEKQDKG